MRPLYPIPSPPQADRSPPARDRSRGPPPRGRRSSLIVQVMALSHPDLPFIAQLALAALPLLWLAAALLPLVERERAALGLDHPQPGARR